MRRSEEKELSGRRNRIADKQKIESMPVSGERMENEMENIVQRTDAVKWFWPFMLDSLIALRLSLRAQSEQDGPRVSRNAVRCRAKTRG